ncbi:bifunctional adenosylcobinamide kinase/adenosylcobinamide-phosphate guanylyltransferase [Nocardia sp. CDC159]|uniref:Bifunctional adenosylcobinamide kinase/adenosylcobinamide-phosphate guanylyltransferase n=1 Tax=Nocardia pulmonis TaxID=2951408 RepID=A0A9X2ECV8_9NOCA|nr:MULTISPECIES: bifunctional adenosylcobinamide kinase/adenosylcobinamide-phosphate guanylyltransferase [Nocardia]MCM6778427.1 bifunctional adenosylcobinamide kinase/adenosylcobinamide-phosphate guanylyltransferase [Nocardia pulmonis]MCM6791316.1 bifunctional adenosylcobinamide kinase/adenosylcobinamide-phosphate guanylyltransferase [Nocardia sp. CDC159]
MTDAAAKPLAAKIEYLFQTVQPLGREYSLQEVADGCRAIGGASFSKAYVWSLRTGHRDNPTMRHLEALAAFFGVPVAYFFDDEAAERVETQLALATALHNADIRAVALRMTKLSNLDRKSLIRIVDEIQRIKEGATAADPEN